VTNRTNDQIVSDFCAAWGAADGDAIIGAFADDAVYHNMPMAPIVGIAAITAFVRSFLTSDRTIEFETLHQVAQGNVVMNERIDIITSDDKAVRLPVMGVFELSGGKITAWRDYFDLASYRGS
jgi:limonene-1,2-epoxide hydrolase